MSLFILFIEFNEICAWTHRERLWIYGMLIMEVRLFLRVININEISSMVDMWMVKLSLSKRSFMISQGVSAELSLLAISAHGRMVHLDDWWFLLFIKVYVNFHFLAHNVLNISIASLIILKWLNLRLIHKRCGHGYFRLTVEFVAGSGGWKAWLILTTNSGCSICVRVNIFAICNFSVLIIEVENVWKVGVNLSLSTFFKLWSWILTSIIAWILLIVGRLTCSSCMNIWVLNLLTLVITSFKLWR